MNRSALLTVCVAGLYGAAGVAAAAAGAHASGDPRLATAANFLMLHAAALIGTAGAAQAFGIGRLVTIPAFGVALGTLLFSGDLIVRVALGYSPMPMAAPSGGVILIVSWLALTVGAAIGALKRRA